MLVTKGAAPTVGREFAEATRIFLNEDFAPKLRQAVGQMQDEDIWWRPNDVSNSVGNIILHLCGNMRQWILGGVGDLPVVRDRPAEFQERGPIDRAALLGRFDETLADVDVVLAGMLDEDLLERRQIQQHYHVSKLIAVYHVVEHFSYHLGQILYVLKLRTGRNPGFDYPV